MCGVCRRAGAGVALFVILGSMTFISIGYVIASYARTEESANALTSIVQFPLMFLSGIFFPIEIMPEVRSRWRA